MNIVRQLRQAKGIQQKELAIEIGVSNATVSDWEHGRKNPSGERLRKLADFFGVEPDVILGSADTSEASSKLFTPGDPKASEKTETEQIIERILVQLGQMPKTTEAKIVSYGMDTLPQEQRELIVNMVTAMYPNNFKSKGTEDDEA